MTARKKGIRSPKEFVRIGICTMDRLATREGAEVSARRKRAMHRVDSELDRSYNALTALLRPDGSLPHPMLSVCSAPGGDLQGALAHARRHAAQSGLIRVAVHGGLADNLDTDALEKAGIPLLILVGHEPTRDPKVDWTASRDGVGIATVNDRFLTSFLHDVILDIWLANHLDQPYRSYIEDARKDEAFFRRKVSFILDVCGDEMFAAGRPHPESSYVSFATLCRDEDDILDSSRLLGLWHRFATSLDLTRRIDASQDTAVDDATRDVAPMPLDMAELVERQCKRSLKLPTLASQIAQHRGKKIAIVVLRKAVRGVLRTRMSSLGLRGINSTFVFDKQSLEWANFEEMVAQMAVDGLVFLVHASLTGGVSDGNP